MRPSDIFQSRYVISGVYVYAPGTLPSFNALKQALTVLCSECPRLTGVVRGCRIVSGEQDHVILIEEVLSAEDDPLSAWQLGRFPAEALAGLPEFEPCPEGSPVFFARVVRARSGAALFSVCLNHAIGDRSTFCRLISRWASLIPGNPEQLAMPITDAQFEYGDSRVKEGSSPVTGFGPTPRGFEAVSARNGYAMRVRELLQGKVTLRKFAFSPADIASLKDRVVRGHAWHQFLARGYRLSAIDVISAALLRMCATIHPSRGDLTGLWAFKVGKSFRGLTPRMPSDFLGNTALPVLAMMPLRDLLAADFSELAFFVRETVEAFGADHCEDWLDFMERYQNARGPVLGHHVFTWLLPKDLVVGRGLTVFDRRTSLAAVNFGGGPPVYVDVPKPSRPGECSMQPLPGGGVEASLCVYAAGSDRILGIDCEHGEPIFSPP